MLCPLRGHYNLQIGPRALLLSHNPTNITPNSLYEQFKDAPCQLKTPFGGEVPKRHIDRFEEV